MKVNKRIEMMKIRQTARIAEKNKPITFICLDCKVKEDIPKDIVDPFDAFNDGDLYVTPIFYCKKCSGRCNQLNILVYMA